MFGTTVFATATSTYNQTGRRRPGTKLVYPGRVPPSPIQHVSAQARTRKLDATIRTPKPERSSKYDEVCPVWSGVLTKDPEDECEDADSSIYRRSVQMALQLLI